MVTTISKTFTGINGGVYTLIQNLEQFKNFIALAKAHKGMFATDTETNGFSYVFNSACGISIGWQSDKNFYLPINHIISDIEANEPIEQLNLQDILQDLQELYGDPNRTWVLQNSKFDLHHLRKLGIEVKGMIQDLLPMTFLLDENDSHALKDCAVKYMHKDADKWEKLIKEWRVGESKRRRKRFSELLKEKEAEYLNDIMFLTKVPVDLTPKSFAKLVAKEALKDHPYQKNKLDEISYDMIPLELMTPYASSDVHYTLILFKIFLTELVKDTNLKELYKNEMLLSNVLFETESHGIKVDKEYLTRIGPELDSKIAGLEKKIYAQVGHEFNLASPKQLAEVFQKLNIRLSKLSNKSKENMREGNYDEQLTYSVDSSVLEELAVKNPFVKDIVELRGAKKIKDTYVDGLIPKLDKNNMVHPSFNANVTSGRLSCREPNLTNVPNSDTTIRRAFINKNNDYIYVLADYSQVELRILAHLSCDKSLLACYPFEGEGVDLHTLTLSEVIMQKPMSQILPMKTDKTGHTSITNKVCECPACFYDFYRKVSKTLNFAVIYGVSGKGLSPQISTQQKFISAEQCDVFIRRWFDKYNYVKLLLKEAEESVKKYGYVFNMYGRKRRFPDYWNSPKWMRSGMIRTAFNFLAQGSAADIFKQAITRMYEEVLKDSKSILVNLVHDETQFYIHKEDIQLIPKLKLIMEDFDLKVPLHTDWSYSTTNWADKKPLPLDNLQSILL